MVWHADRLTQSIGVVVTKGIGTIWEFVPNAIAVGIVVTLRSPWLDFSAVGVYYLISYHENYHLFLMMRIY